MTKNEAYVAMEQGKKITHEFFDDNEFLYMKNGTIYMENGCRFNNREDGYDGWEDRNSESFQTNWSIKK